MVTKTVFHLWETFGGTVNSKGYKVLNPHIKAIYGDSITPQRAERIFKTLIENGFACNNVSLGVGSFSMQCLEEGDILKPYTRDTFGIAVKATYGEIGDKPLMIFKNPKTDDGNFKKSQCGMCCVFKDAENNIVYQDGFDKNTFPMDKENLLKPVFQDGKMAKEFTLKEVRDILHGGEF